MILSLSSLLLKFLLEQGYEYCLSKSIGLDGYFIDNIRVDIFLVPSLQKPHLRALNNGFDTYYNTSSELIPMVEKLNGANIKVQLDNIGMANYITFLTRYIIS